LVLYKKPINHAVVSEMPNSNFKGRGYSIESQELIDMLKDNKGKILRIDYDSNDLARIAYQRIRSIRKSEKAKGKIVDIQKMSIRENSLFVDLRSVE